ncbi:MAG: queuosine precursor transporter [Candidatus Diapherotrites archaeon]|nr:queuosine precursor transporter [Candidatus Diapherotrites archaeon]
MEAKTFQKKLNYNAQGNKVNSFKFLAPITGLFVAVLIISNIASTKITDLGFLVFDAGTLLFPLSYIFGDILTEVYGYKKSRQVIWTGFISLILMSLIFWIIGLLPAAADWNNQEAFELILGIVPRIVIASLIAFFLGEFSNSFILAKMKIWSKGKNLWQRTIGSTLIGEGIDSIAFVLIAFYGVLPNELLIAIIASNYVFKVGIEILFTPITYWITGFLKKQEGVDVYDTNTDFNPFKIE